MRKTLGIMTGLLSLSLTVTGCGANDKGNTGTTNQTPAAGGGGAAVSLNFLQNKPEVVKEWDKLIADFQKQNPTITVKQINPPNTDTALQAALAKGQMPDIIAMGADATFIQMAKNNVFKDFTGTPQLSKVSNSYTKMLQDAVGKPTPFALPYTVNAVPIIYNADLLKKYNVNVPTTWNELMAAADKIKAAGGAPFYNGFKDAWTLAPMWNALAANTEPTTFKSQLTGGTASFAKDNATATDRMRQFVSYGQPNQFGIDYNGANTAFANGNAVFYAQGIWTLPVLRSANPKISLGTFAIPSDDASKTVMVSGVDSLLTVTKSGNTAKEDAAMKFIDFLLDPKNAGEYANVAGLFSTVNGVKNSDAALAPLQTYIDQNRVTDFDDHYYPPAMAAGNQYESVLQGALSKNQPSSAILQQLDALYKQSAAHK